MLVISCYPIHHAWLSARIMRDAKGKKKTVCREKQALESDSNITEMLELSERNI